MTNEVLPKQEPARPAAAPARVLPAPRPVPPAAAAPSCPQLAQALCAARKKVRPIEKDAVNAFHRYKYASADGIIEEALRAMDETGLALVPIRQTIDGHEARGANRFELTRHFLLIHTSGETLPVEVVWPIVPDERGRPLDKAAAAAVTLSLAYYLRDLLLMPRVDPAEQVEGREDRPAARPAAARPAAAKPRRKPEPRTPAELLAWVHETDTWASRRDWVAEGALFTAVLDAGRAEGWGDAIEKWPQEAVSPTVNFVRKQLQDMKAARAGQGGEHE